MAALLAASWFLEAPPEAAAADLLAAIKLLSDWLMKDCKFT